MPLSPVWNPTVLTPFSRWLTGSTDSTPGRSAAVAAQASTSVGRGRGHDEHLGTGEQGVALAEVLVEGALRRALGQQLGARRGELHPQGGQRRARRAGRRRRVMTTHGIRCTTSARREKTPTSPATSVPRRSSRRAPSAHSAGMRERATARATSTTDTPAALTARMNGISSTIRPASEMATVSAENTTVRPARSIVVAVASATCSRVSSATGAPVEQGAHLLAEARHDEQAVVDAQAERRAR